MIIDYSNLDIKDVKAHNISETEMFYKLSSYMMNGFTMFHNLIIANCTSGIETLHIITGGVLFIKRIHFENFNSERLGNMKCAFMSHNMLEEINIEALDTSNVTDMSHMFQDCKKLKSLNLTRMNTSKVCSMVGMFKNCCNLEKLDLSSFDTRNVEYINLMFSGCTNLRFIDLSSLNLMNIKSQSRQDHVFDHCYSLRRIILPKDKDTRNKIYNMIKCSSIDIYNIDLV